MHRPPGHRRDARTSQRARKKAQKKPNQSGKAVLHRSRGHWENQLHQERLQTPRVRRPWSSVKFIWSEQEGGIGKIDFEIDYCE